MVDSVAVRGMRKSQCGGGQLHSNNSMLCSIGGKDNGRFSFFSGFMFAAKMKSVASRLVSRLESRRYLSLRENHLQFFNDKTIVPDEKTGVFKSGVANTSVQ